MTLDQDSVASAPQNSPRLPDSTASAAGTVLAFDVGDQRIGVAVGESILGIAHPLTTITATDRSARNAAIAQLMQDWKPALVVVGLPVHMDGSEHEMTRRCRNFARSLEGRFHVPARLVDERLSSRAAAGALHEAGVSGRRQKNTLDQVAAQLILQSHFDATA